MRIDPILNTPSFPISRLKSPKHAETFEICCRQTFGKPSPLSGRKVAVPPREACTPVAQILALQYSTSELHAFYRTNYADYIFSEEVGKFCDREDSGFLCAPCLRQPTPTLIDVIYRAKYGTLSGHVNNVNMKMYDTQAY